MSNEVNMQFVDDNIIFAEFEKQIINKKVDVNKISNIINKKFYMYSKYFTKYSLIEKIKILLTAKSISESYYMYSSNLTINQKK